MGAFLLSVMGLALALVPVLMFPVLKRHDETLALGYVVFRGGLETVTTIAWSICVLFLPPLRRTYVQTCGPDAVSLEPLGFLLLGAKDLSFTVGEIVFPWVR